MYRRNGQPMPEHEEGAAFFKPIAFGEDEVWGVSKNLLTKGFGEDDPFKSVRISDEEAARRSGATTIPEITVEGDPIGHVEFYETPFWRIFALAGAAVGAYHGYKRNNSVGWGIAWGFLGSVFPIIVIPIAVAQGIGKPKGRS